MFVTSKNVKLGPKLRLFFQLIIPKKYVCNRPVDYSSSGVRSCHKIPLRSGFLAHVIFVAGVKRLFWEKLCILCAVVVMFVMCEIYQ